MFFSSLTVPRFSNHSSSNRVLLSSTIWSLSFEYIMVFQCLYKLWYLGEGNGHPLQYSCLENPMNGGAWQVWSMESQRVRHNWATSFHLTSKLNTIFGMCFLWPFKSNKCHTIFLNTPIYEDIFSIGSVLDTVQHAVHRLAHLTSQQTYEIGTLIIHFFKWGDCSIVYVSASQALIGIKII